MFDGKREAEIHGKSKAKGVVRETQGGTGGREMRGDRSCSPKKTTGNQKGRKVRRGHGDLSWGVKQLEILTHQSCSERLKENRDLWQNSPVYF